MPPSRSPLLAPLLPLEAPLVPLLAPLVPLLAPLVPPLVPPLLPSPLMLPSPPSVLFGMMASSSPSLPQAAKIPVSTSATKASGSFLMDQKIPVTMDECESLSL